MLSDTPGSAGMTAPIGAIDDERLRLVFTCCHPRTESTPGSRGGRGRRGQFFGAGVEVGGSSGQVGRGHGVSAQDSGGGFLGVGVALPVGGFLWFLGLRFLRKLASGTGDWIELAGAAPPRPVAQPADDDGDDDMGGIAEVDDVESASTVEQPPVPTPRAPAPAPARPDGPRKVFIAHGKNREPLEQLKKALDLFKVKYAVAVDEPNKGRPISKKVAELMKTECSSGIFIFTADERFLKESPDGSTVEIWRPSENVVYELGAAAILYENRIVIFKEEGVTFPSDFSDLGHIEFAKDQLGTELGNLFKELVALDIVEVVAKG